MTLRSVRTGFLVFLINITSIFVGLEVIQRLFPQVMPYAYHWHVRNHYSELARSLSEAGYLESKRPHILLIGDSFTRGAEVPIGYDWASIVQEEVSANVFNLGVGGLSTLAELLLLKNVPLPSSVDTIVLNIYENDVVDNIHAVQKLGEKGHLFFQDKIRSIVSTGLHSCWDATWFLKSECYYIKSYNFASIVHIKEKLLRGDEFLKEIHDFSQWVFDESSQTYFFKENKLLEYRSIKNFEAHYRNGFEITFEMIQQIQEYCNQHGLKLLATYFPSKVEVYYQEVPSVLNTTSLNPNLTVSHKLDEFFRKTQIPFLNLTENYQKVRKQEAPIFLEFDIHMTENGHRLAAHWIRDFILEQR